MNKEKRSPKTLTKIKQAKIFKQIIMTPHSYTHSYVNEKHSTTLDIETLKKE